MYSVKRAGNKYRAVKCDFNGRRFDSKHEASVAMWLEAEKQQGLIKGYDCQFRVEMVAYDRHGKPVMRKNHRVDFRAHNNDGTFSLIEAKGFDTDDWKERRRWLEALWLPENPDHDYTVIYNRSNKFAKGK